LANWYEFETWHSKNFNNQVSQNLKTKYLKNQTSKEVWKFKTSA
jgi:hypothetical protein